MSSERGFWRSLGSVETLAALLVDWQSAMGKEFELGRQFLKPTTQQSEVYPCIKDPPCLCWHEVVECSDGRLMAGCTCEGEDNFGCRAFQVELKDLMIYAMDQRILTAGLQRALKLEAVAAENLGEAWPIGLHPRGRWPVS